MITYTQEDCMAGMKRYPDKYFDLAICDPPYGIGDKLAIGGTKGMKFCERYQGSTRWDTAPPREYFTELNRVSKNQIIWGGNYFNLGVSRGFCVWDKIQPVPNFSACEFAWTSFDCPSKIFRLSNNQFDVLGRFHPTQKPVALYKWLLTKYAKTGDKILDTHVGSASSLIACHDMGFDAVGFELDADYYRTSKQRLDDFMRQPRIDAPVLDAWEQMGMEEAK